MSEVELRADDYPDSEVEERLYELYRNHCQQNGLTPTIRDFVIWKEENYQ